MKKLLETHLKKLKSSFLLKVMKVQLILFLIGIMGNMLHAEKVYSQETISLKLNNIDIETLFSEIEQRSEYIILYKESDRLKKKISVDATNKSIESILNETISPHGLRFHLSGKQIIITEDEIKNSRQPQTVLQEKKNITGTVTDINGDPVIGVNILEVGTTNGTITNFDGKYSIEVQPKSRLQFSYISYKTIEINVGNKAVIDMVMEEDLSTLDEVVVIGYGSVRKKDLTGAVAGMREDVLQQTKSSSFVNSMQGRIAGVQITSGSGEPGSGAKVIIRGANTLAGSSDPLYVIDGIQINESDAPLASSQFGQNSQRNPLSSINPADIVSIDVLKDASSTAIYGSKGANGVVIITTRQGQEGAPMINYDGSFGFSYASKKIKMLNGDDWLDYRKDWTLMPDGNRVEYGYFNDWLFFLNAGETDPAKMNPRDVYALPEYDWQDEMYRTALSTAHNLSITGGTKNTKYAASLGYNNEEGLLMNNDYSRYNARMKLDHTQNRFIVSLSLSASYSKYNGAAQSGDGYNNMGILQTALVSRPLVFDNPLAVQTQGGWKEPTKNLQHVKRVSSTPNISANTTINYKLLEGLYIGTTLSGTIVTSKCNEFYGKETPWGYYLKGRGAITNSEWIGWSNINTLSYDVAFKNTRLNALAAFELNGSKYETNSIIKSNFADETTGIHDISKGTTLESATSAAGPLKRASFLGRLNYTIFDRYLITTSLRANGSDRFGEDNRWGYFPSAALAWRLSEEPFMKKFSALDNLKLRFSYGRTGNSNIPEFQYMARMGNSFYGDQLGLVPASMPNPKLKWETTIQYNVGADLTLWGGILDLSVDLYNKKTTDMLYLAIIPAQSGFKNQWQNLGEINNKGIEVSLNTHNINTKNFSWSSGITLSSNKNRVIEIGNGLDVAPIGAGTWSLSYIKLNDVGRIMKNQPIGIMYGYQMDGIYQMSDFSGWVDKTGTLDPNDPNIPWHQRGWTLNEGVVDCSALAAPRPGTFKFKNLDGSEDNKITESDKVIIGKSEPKLFGGISNNFKYKNVELGVFLTYSIGGEVFNSTKFELEGAYPGEYYNITDKFWKNRWTPENPTNSYPSYSDMGYYNTLAAQPNTYYIEDASYLRLQNISLSYTLPKSLSKKMGLNNVKVYYSGNNLYTFSDYTGFTPEVDSGNALLSGFDVIGYPRATSHIFGLNVTF